MSSNAKEAILSAARKAAQAHGYGGLNFRDLAAVVGIKAASIHYHFPSKADLGAAVARRYWEDTATELKAMQAAMPDPLACLRHYPAIFRRSLENGNRICLCSFMAAEYDDLPEPVKVEVQAFADVNVTWLGKVLMTAEEGDASTCNARALAIFAAVSGAQLLARSRADVGLFDRLIASYRDTGLLPG
jgi:TetR/AcrR family transcriptional regulator, transcriptional repressor for nem operon